MSVYPLIDHLPQKYIVVRLWLNQVRFKLCYDFNYQILTIIVYKIYIFIEHISLSTKYELIILKLVID